MEAVAAVCHRFGFEVRTTDDLPLDAEIELFATTRVLAAVQGSGLFNMAFRKGAPLSVLEILPPGVNLATPRPLWSSKRSCSGTNTR
jgi:capsular polysaccharide biosynthesis protein